MLIVVILITIIMSYVYKDEVMASSYDTVLIWLEILIPSMHFTLILADLLSKTNLKNIIPIKIYIFLMSLIIGNPGGAKFINNLNKEGILDDYNSRKLINYTSFISPLYLLFFVLKLDYNVYLFLGIYFFSSFYIYFLLDNSYLKKPMIKKSQLSINEFIKSIKDNSYLMLTVLGFILFFNNIYTILFNVFGHEKYIIYLNLFLEINSGLNNLFSFDYNNMECLLMIFLIFGGLSIHFQIKSIYPCLDYKMYFLKRIIIILVALYLLKYQIIALIILVIALLIKTIIFKPKRNVV